MRRLLLQLDTDRHPSVFDRIVAHDAGADAVLSYGGVEEADVAGLIQGAIFTRGPKDLKNSAVFIGGCDVAAAERLLAAARKTFFGPFRVSLMLDANGCNTTAAAAVVKLVQAAGGDASGRRALLLAATGPVGQRAAGLLTRLGARVRITSRDAERAKTVARSLGERWGGAVEWVGVGGATASREQVGSAELLLASGPAGVQLVAREAWTAQPNLRAVADVNAVPPAGIEGVEATDNGAQREGVAVFGALGVGGLKMKVHRAALARLFEQNDLVLDAEEIYGLAAGL